MKVLLTAVNAKFIHSNLAIYSLKAYAHKYKSNIELAEFTINNYMDDIIQEIYKKKPDIAAFSCYIWNFEMMKEAASELRKILPDLKIWFGGPEVSYDSIEMLEQNPYVDGVMIGEGEASFLELMEYYQDRSRSLSEVKGIAWKKTALLKEDEKEYETPDKKEIYYNGNRVELDMSSIPFSYENMAGLANKIIYYESSRGCPYSCSYCLSSVDKNLRFRKIDLVKEELAFFLKEKVPQVKFVDRTFNCRREHTMAIWSFIKENDNGITNFHFEISADILREEELLLLKTMRPGLVQLEIGVQSTNLDTLIAIQRKMDFSVLSNVVQRIKQFKNIHQHLDLIAGLPYEDLESFKQSFLDVYALRPDQLQLGFLKVLKGSAMHEQKIQNQLEYRDKTPYEVLSTKWMGYDQIIELKQVEKMVEVYYNSGQFVYSMEYLEHFFEHPYDLYLSLGQYYECNGLDQISHTRIGRYYNLLSFFLHLLNIRRTAPEAAGKLKHLFSEILVYDLYLRENLKSRPEFCGDNSIYKNEYRTFIEKEKTEKGLLHEYISFSTAQIGRMIHMEHFDYNIPEAVKMGVNAEKEEMFILFDYKNRNPLNHEASAVFLPRNTMLCELE